MAARPPRQSDKQRDIRFTISGLLVFSVALILTGGLLGSGLFQWSSARSKASSTDQPSAASAAKSGDDPQSITPPWGELVASEIDVERPEEYIASEITTYHTPEWVFKGMSSEQARKTMLTSGLTPDQARRALSPGFATSTNEATVVHPEEELIFALDPVTRSNLYSELGRFGENHFMQFPYCVPGTNVAGWFEGSNVDDATIDRIRRLLYAKGDTQCFSDFEIVMRGLPSDHERLRLVKALSRQRALLVRVRIRPDTDIDKILGYWDRGIQMKDARPLLESVKRLPSGGTMSLLYLLPRFARERLYTFPLPPKPDDPAMDCHWSTLNFFNEKPDDRFARPEFTASYVQTNYYPVAKPNQYGDVIFILDKKGSGIHSAVYLADDIVFTKNGNNYAQPWMLMRLKDLTSTYTARMPVTIAFYRRNGW